MYARLSTGAAYEFLPSIIADTTPLPAILFVHGWNSNIFTSATYNELATQLRAVGFHCMFLSLRGHAESLGDLRQVTRANHIEDIHAAVEHIKNMPEVDSTNLQALGSSYGAYLLATMVPQQIFSAIVLRAPALYPDSGWSSPTAEYVGQDSLLHWRSLARDVSDSRALVGVSVSNCPVLVVWSGSDEVLPKTVFESYLHAANKCPQVESHVITGAGHSIRRESRDEYLAVVVPWFSSRH